ncbi:MAG: TRAM domain-containing protein, partial [Bacteroidota bacterium]|nr:TRAM domain-containing protein [Bacteroidota bacterium]
GFCGETENDHKETLKLMKEIGFDYAYMFKYSERPNTFAARNLDDDVSEEIKSRRLSEIIELQSKLSLESNKKDLGKTFEVLVEGISKKSDKQVHGRNSQYKVFIFDGDKSMIGKLIKVKVVKYSQATLFGEAI